MRKNWKEYWEYRRNKSIIKRELAKMTAAALPVVMEVLAAALQSDSDTPEESD